MVNAKLFCHLVILLLSFCFMLVKCSLEPTDQFIDSPTDTKQDDALILHKRPSFFVGSRYGRSGSSSSGSSVFATSKIRRLNVVPRNDRFFLSSRYGKRAGMDFLQNHNKNNKNKNSNTNTKIKTNTNDNSILLPMLSTPYEQALISEISTGTQLSNMPIPQQKQEFNDDFNTKSIPPQRSSSTSSSSASSLSSSSVPPYDYMSCVYTGLQNYYRCNSIESMFYFKNSVINDNDNDDENEVLSADTTGAALFNNDDDDNTDDDNNHDDNEIDENDKK